MAETFEAQRAQYRAFVQMRLAAQSLNVVIYAGILPLALDALVRATITVGHFLLVMTLMIQLIRNVFDMANALPDTYDMIGSIRDSLDMLIVPRDIRDRPGATDFEGLERIGLVREGALSLRSCGAGIPRVESHDRGRTARAA